MTPHQTAETELTVFALSLPETDVVPGIPPTRYMRVKGKGFCVFGGKGEPADALTIIVKLPISAEMVQQLYFVRESKGWYKQHNWVIAHFGPDDDILAERDTLKAWIRQSYIAMAPKRLGKMVEAGFKEEE
ncbi:MAG: MmcQ/YjbR family DNA-binding protein [Alphaproteobacteria bacterium]